MRVLTFLDVCEVLCLRSDGTWLSIPYPIITVQSSIPSDSCMRYWYFAEHGMKEIGTPQTHEFHDDNFHRT